MTSLLSSSFVYFYLVSFMLTLLLFHAEPAQARRSFDILSSPATGNSSSSSSSSNSTSNKLKWVGPVGHRLITVDLKGSGDFRSVQSAVNAVPNNNTVNVIIHIKPGCYM